MGIPDGSYDLVPLDGMLKTVARRMTDSFRDVPHFPLNIDLEIDQLLAARVKINGLLEKQGVKVSVNDLVIKAAALALTLHHGALPPTINQTRPDPACDLDYVPIQAREYPVRTAISTSFGFGGQNAALVMQRFAR